MIHMIHLSTLSFDKIFIMIKLIEQRKNNY